MLKRPQYIALSFVLLLVVVVVNLPNQTATQCKLAMGGFFLPLFGLAASTHHLAESVSTSLTPRPALVAELQRLRRETEQFRVREVEVEEIRRENERLREALHLQKQLRWKVQLARVILRDPANWWRTVQIDIGRRDGITNNQTVLSVDGQLVGRIKQVGYSSSRVALVGDPDCRVSAVVEDGGSRQFGVITSGASSILDASLVDLTWVNNTRQSALKPGQRVLTSGLGGVFPPNILVGHVVDTNSVGFGLYTEARVKLSTDLGNLEEVWVVLAQ
jgi:rod shape-determining protein MreC